MILLWMIFLHIIDDYNLQGWLANAKQKQWWTDNAPQDMYKRDYLMALFMHSFSWAFMIMLPIMIANGFKVNTLFFTVFIVNVFLHCVIDNLKANSKKINLIQDQSLHILQIVLTYILLRVI